MKIVKTLLLILFIIFLIFYLSFKNSYSSYENYKKTTLTNEEIKQFEKDVKNGKDINIKKYLDVHKPYTNNLSKFGLKASIFIETFLHKIIRNSLEKLVKFLI